MDTIEERLPPNSIEAEEAVLGSILIDPDAYYEVARILTRPTDFYSTRNRWVWEAIRQLSDAGLAIDVVTVIDKPRQHGHQDEAGGERVVLRPTHAAHTTKHIQRSPKIRTQGDSTKRR